MYDSHVIHSRPMKYKNFDIVAAFYNVNRIASRSDVKNTYPYLLGMLFSEEFLQRRDFVSLSFWKLYIPYRIGAFSGRYEKLSGIVEM
jgi:hypothetical protein